MNKDDRIAPSDGMWVCAACGKTAEDRYGIKGPHTSGWDESCFLNVVLCKRGDVVIGQRVTKADPYEEESGAPWGVE